MWSVIALRCLAHSSILFPRRSLRRLIDAAMPERAFHGFQVASPFPFDPFQISKSRAIGELIQHPNRNHVREVRVACGDSFQLAVFSFQ